MMNIVKINKQKSSTFRAFLIYIKELLFLARKVGLEPTSTGSEPAVLPLDYFRIFWRAISESNRAFEVCNLTHSLSVNGSNLIKITVKPKFNYFTNIIINVFKLSSIKSFPIRFPFNFMSFFKVYSVSFFFS